MKNKIAVFSDNNLNIGITTEIKVIDAKILELISVFFENKSLTQPLRNIRVKYEADKSIKVYKKPTEIPNEFLEGSQH